MSDDNFQKRVMVLCEEALSVDADQRPGFLDTACAEEPELRTAVEKLMRTLDSTSDFLLPATEETELQDGDHVGDYRVLKSLGQGGMGTVYLAERVAEGYSQRVALKIMRTHLQSRDMISRFNEERRLLARLHHPYIARLMDGGAEKGLPYLVTELVEGVPIDVYCDTHQLTIKQRLDLIQRVALALQSAHQNLVIHSDLKPGNILITEDGIPKLLDFGVARLVQPVDDTPSDKPDSLVALTPEYASPEQIRGEPVTTLSDVYSLGVLTYALLVGETPYPLAVASRDVMIEELRSVQKRRPSEHVLAPRQSGVTQTVASARKTQANVLSKQLLGDLDAILLKALDPDPAQRYPSALVFASDLKNYCRSMPVTAMGDTSSYRLSKFVRRHRFSVAAGVLALIGMVGGLSASLWQAHIAEKRFDDLHGFAETVIFDMHDEIANLPGGTAARQLMTRESLHYLDRLAADAGNDRDLQLDLAGAYKRLGDVLGNPTNANMGDVASAIDSYSKALHITRKLSDGASGDPLIERQSALIHEKLGDTLAWTGDLDGAVSHANTSFTLFKRLLDTHPDENEAIMSVAISGVKRGDLLGHPSFPNVGQEEEALRAYRDALATIEPLAQDREASARTVRYFALIHERVGTMLSQAESFDEALVHFNQSMELRKKMAAADPANANARRDAAIALEKIADVRLASGQAEASIAYYEEALSEYRALAESDPANANAARTLAIGLENLADALIVLGDVPTARAHFDELLAIRRELAAQNPANERFQTELEAKTRKAASL